MLSTSHHPRPMEVLHALTLTCVMDSFRLGRDPTKVPASQEWKEKLPLVRTGESFVM